MSFIPYYETNTYPFLSLWYGYFGRNPQIATPTCFDPRIDGFAAPVGAVWCAVDCKIAFRHVAPDPFAWVLAFAGQTPAILGCDAAAEVNALLQGLSRHPELDFTPTNGWRPDAAGDRLFDFVNGDHLTRQGGGAGASIGDNPYFDELSTYGKQAQQLTDQASFYAATNGNVGAVAGEDFVLGWAQALWQTPSGDGGLTIGKESWAPGAQLGYKASMNSFGGYGYEVSGSLGLANTDSTFGTLPIDDGRTHWFSLWRSNVGPGSSGIRTAGRAPVTLPGLLGDLSDAAARFGLMAQAGAFPATCVAYGSLAYMSIMFWKGQAATNYIANMAAIEAAIQSMFGDAIVEAAVSTANLNPVSATPGTRPIDGTPFVPSVFNTTTLIYSIRMNFAGAGAAYWKLSAGPVGGAFQEIMRAGQQALGAQDCWVVLTFDCPPHWQVKIEKVNVVGVVPTFILETQTEESWRP